MKKLFHRNRKDEFKADLIKKFKENILPLFEEKKLNPIIDQKVEINWESNPEEMVDF